MHLKPHQYPTNIHNWKGTSSCMEQNAGKKNLEIHLNDVK